MTVSPTANLPVHPWLKKLGVAYLPGPATPLLDEVAQKLLHMFERLGHQVQDQPDDDTEVIFSPARFGEPVDWRKAPLLTVRRRFGLSRTP